MRIGLDVDGPLANWELAARTLLNEEFGLSLPISTEWNSIRNAVTQEQWKWLWSPDVLFDLFTIPQPYPGIRQGVEELRKIGDVVIITSVPKEAIPARLYWLINQHDIVFDEFRVVDSTQKKSSVVPRCDVYIDDSESVGMDILEKTDSAFILWDRPWNQSFHREYNQPRKSRNMYARVSDWNDLLLAMRNMFNIKGLVVKENE